MAGELVNVRTKNECFMRKWFFNFVNASDGKKKCFIIFVEKNMQMHGM